jgi:hypothetical protein
MRSSVLAALAALALPGALATRPVSKVHLAVVTDDPTQMNVQWVSGDGVTLGGTSTVQYGTSPRALSNTVLGFNWTYVSDPDGRTYVYNLATMTDLTPGGTYFYRVGDPLDGWSAVSSFAATRAPSAFTDAAPLRLAVFGDLGWTNAQALSYLQSEAASGAMDLFVHVGDYAYDLNVNNGSVGDSFQDSVEPITSSAPYVGCIGNHEGFDSQAMYMHRFRVFSGNASNGGLTPSGVPGVTPGLPNNLYYSLNIGPLHLAAMSTEMYFTGGPGAAAQYAWLDADLAAVDRARTPWVVVYGHRSIYCSCDSDCDAAATAVRDGVAGEYGMEALLNKHGVDLWINGHEHDYERNYPTLNSTLATPPSSGKPGGNASAPEVIVDPAAPVYIVTGCAGDKEGHEPFTRPQPAYSAFRSNTYGYARLTFVNASTLLWEAVQTDNEYPATTGTVIDAMLLVNTKH